MSAQPITLAVWERMPWHTKAKTLAALDHEQRAIIERNDELRAEQATLQEQIDELRRNLRTRLVQLHNLPETPERVIWDHEDHWTDAELRMAHRSYVHGDRDEWTVTGHRIWDKQRARRRYERHKEANRERMRVRRAKERAERENGAA